MIRTSWRYCLAAALATLTCWGAAIAAGPAPLAAAAGRPAAGKLGPDLIVNPGAQSGAYLARARRDAGQPGRLRRRRRLRYGDRDLRGDRKCRAAGTGRFLPDRGGHPPLGQVGPGCEHHLRYRHARRGGDRARGETHLGGCLLLPDGHRAGSVGFAGGRRRHLLRSGNADQHEHSQVRRDRHGRKLPGSRGGSTLGSRCQLSFVTP
jgi:hypothetical protein